VPQVTILMPVRDGARFLDEAIQSVITDEFTDFELVAVDDGSVDATPDILRGWARRDPRIAVVTLDRPGGIAAARNRGLAVARAEFVAPHDADDLFVGGRIRPQLEALRRDPSAVLVCGHADVVDANGRRLFTRLLAEYPEVMAHLLTFSNPITHGTAMFRRAEVRAAGGYDESLMVSHDYDLWLRLAARGPILTLPMVSLRHRWHDGQITAVERGRQRAESFANTQRALTAALGREPGPAEADAAASVWRADGRPSDLAAADRVFDEALRRSPHAGDPAFRRRIEVLTAEHWTAAAARLALAGHAWAALTCLRHARRWHPHGMVGGSALVMRTVGRLGALRWRTGRLGSRVRPRASLPR
jgi:GT2 family glycosyltransferase